MPPRSFQVRHPLIDIVEAEVPEVADLVIGERLVLWNAMPVLNALSAAARGGVLGIIQDAPCPRRLSAVAGVLCPDRRSETLLNGVRETVAPLADRIVLRPLVDLSVPVVMTNRLVLERVNGVR